MSKKSKRPGREARDIHATIRADAAKLKAAEKFGTHDGAEFAELNLNPAVTPSPAAQMAV